MATDLSGDGGVMKQTTKAGAEDRKPQPGETVFAHYTGKLDNGQVFDSSIGKPHRKMGFFFQLGAGQVIKGWDVGFGNMQIGEHATLVCKPDYAYGSGGGGPIPPNATLTFEVQLLDSKKMTPKELQDLNMEVERLRG
eukprot:TRINITY_DN16948_c0_g1_i1.p1 TRINITY_DN16948_c0_g1~~TRINITY_DN16948_c0_g1_i1.p1  ORF type:complete len:138 (-),score=43.49 TRINITY_DN16948_c0_g1_i1:218-631(-)